MTEIGGDVMHRARSSAVRVSQPISAALRERRAVVALESSVLAQGLPVPANAEAARRMTDAICRAGAVPAITGVVRGVAAAGLEDAELARFLRRDGVAKLSARDLPMAIARGVDGATTVAGALVIAALAGIPVFVTGGIGGVHREPSFDESADLVELARTPAVVVCAGAKAIVDLRATMERLETLGVPVLGYRTSELPAFYATRSGIALSARAESAAEVAAVWRAHRALGRTQSLVVVQPPPESMALEAEVVERAIARALERARRERVLGAEVTPFLLAAVDDATEGRARGANLALLEGNAVLAAEIAQALAGWRG